MNSQNNKIVLQFSKDYKQFSLHMKLYQSEKLQIKVINNSIFTQYFTCIDRSYVGNQQSFRDIILLPSDIIYYVKDNFSSVVVSEGQILVNFIIRRKANKQIRIKLKKIDNPQTTKLKKINKKLQDQLIYKDKIISTLEKRVQKAEEYVQDIEKITLKFRGEINLLKKQIQNINNQNKISSSQEIKKQELSPLRRIPKQNNQKLSIHPQCPHQQHFQTFITNGSILKIERSTPNCWYNFTNIRQIKTGEVIIYRVKIKKLTKQYLGVGFGTKSAFGIVKASQPQGIFYLYNGNIYQFGGTAKTDRLACDAQDIVEAQCDLKNKTVWWWKNGKKIGDSKIPNNLANKSFYLMVIMNFQGDSLQISEQK